MGGVNSIPVVSQAKSGFQLICNDVDGAAETQKDFLQQCPVVSQVTSTVQLMTGNVDAAIETQKKCGTALLRTVDGIPLVGHAKGAIHYACGDMEGGDRAMISATRTTGVMSAGAAGFLVGGPVGAIAGGVMGGAAFDTTVTVVDSVASNEFKPSGYYAAINNFVKNPNAGDIFDTFFIPVGDGLAGYSGGRLVQQLSGSSSSSAGASSAEASSSGAEASAGQPPAVPPPPGAAELAKATLLETQAEAILEAAEAGKAHMPSGEYLRMSNEAMAIWKEAQTLKAAPPPPSEFMDIKVTKTAMPPAPKVSAPIPQPIQPPELHVDSGDTVAQNKQQQTLPANCTTVVQTWVLWISDEVFVSGTTKEIVELTTAFLVKDIATVEEICKQLNIDPKAIFGEEYASYTYDKIAELAFKSGCVYGISENELIEVIKKRGQKGRQAVKQFFSNLFQHKGSEKEKDKRSKRGEHVINNGVINVHRDIMEKFLVRSGITRDGLGALTRLTTAHQTVRDCSEYFHPKTKENIQNVLKVFIDEDTAYVDANALLYGTTIQLLRESAVTHMLELYSMKSVPRNEGTSQTRALKEILRTMNDNLLYVDQNALSIWLTQNGTNGRRTYERAQITVENMFAELYARLAQWIRELKRHGY